MHFWDGSAGVRCHDAGMRIFHIATAADWERARESGSYTTSTRGRSLEDEGFLHAAHRPQVQGVFRRYYRDVREPLLLLTIDTERLGVPWREDEGFLHAAHRPQVQGVFQRYYRDVREPLLLLTIDTERIGVPWREEEVGEDSFPHIYGPLSPRAVVDVQPLNASGGTQPFTSLFVREMLLRISLGVVAMLLAGAGSIVGGGFHSVWGELVGALIGLAVGIALSVLVLRRR